MDQDYDMNGHQKTHATIIARIQKGEWKRADGTRQRITENEKKHLLRWDKNFRLNRASYGRRIKVLGDILCAMHLIKEDFLTATREQIEDLVLAINESPRFGERYKADLRSNLKQFFKWLNDGEHPAKTRWIKCAYDKRKVPKKKPSDNLTEEERNTILNAAESTRDRAWISLWLETGLRPKELSLLKIRHVTFDADIAFVTVPQYTKTGQRTIPIISCRPYMVAWLNDHPLKHCDDAWLWPNFRRVAHLPLTYNGFRSILRRLLKKTKLKKRVTHYSARHTSYSDKAEAGWSDQKNKRYHGLDPSSNQLTTYVHMKDESLINDVKNFHGIEAVDRRRLFPQPTRPCAVCAHENGIAEKRCMSCGTIIDPTVARQKSEERASLKSEVETLKSTINTMHRQIMELVARNVEARTAKD